MKHIRNTSRSGYYYLQLKSVGQNNKLLPSNTSRAFVVAQLQDLLAVRTVLEEPLARRLFASHIDLLAFSILPTHITLIVFSIASTSVKQLGGVLANRIAEFDQTAAGALPIHVHLRAIDGVHNALVESISLHLEHTDWEADRYSSIGFFIHDRRGDWMRLWRLAEIFDHDPDQYLSLLNHQRLTTGDAWLHA